MKCHSCGKPLTQKEIDSFVPSYPWKTCDDCSGEVKEHRPRWVNDTGSWRPERGKDDGVG